MPSIKQDYLSKFWNWVQNPPWIQLVEFGMIPGISTLDKFGENTDIDTATVPEDIWEGGGLYTYDAAGTAPIVSIASNSALDTQPIKITGLDITGAQVSQYKTLQGTTRLALDTPLWRVYRLENESGVYGASVAADLNGMVFVYTGTGAVPSTGDPEVRAIINDGNNQTLMALYTIPLGKVGFLYRGEAGISRLLAPATAVSAQGAYFSRRLGGVFKIKKRIDLVSLGSSIYTDKRSFPGVLPALTDIKLTILAVSANDVGVWGTFDILLIDEDKFPDDFLTAIGQPTSIV